MVSLFRRPNYAGETPTLRMLGVLLLIILVASCTSANKAKTITGEGSAPIIDQLKAPGHQNRILPWDVLTLSSTMTYRLTPEKEDDAVGLTPGLYAASERLRARESALDDLARRLNALPAAEPPPGETETPTVGEFAKHHPAINEQIETIFHGGWSETTDSDQQGRARLKMEIPLKDLAEAILLRGGGFSPTSRIGQELNARQVAQHDAMEQARRNLTAKVGKLTWDKKMSYAEAAGDTIIADKLTTAIKGARVVRSEEAPGKESGRQWIVELELDPDALRESLTEDFQRLKEEAKKPEARTN